MYEGESQRLLCFQHCLWSRTIFTPTWVWVLTLGSGSLGECGLVWLCQNGTLGKARHMKGSWNPFSLLFLWLSSENKTEALARKLKTQKWICLVLNVSLKVILTVCIVYASGFMGLSKIGILNCPWSSVSVIVKTHNRFLRSMDLEHSGQLSTEDCMQPIQCIFAILASGETHFPCPFISLLYPHLRFTYLIVCGGATFTICQVLNVRSTELSIPKKKKDHGQEVV